MNVINLKGEARNNFGKQATRTLRTEGKVPCVIYGGESNVHFSMVEKELKELVYTSDFHLVEVEVEGNSFKTIVKDVQFHPVSEIIEHVDFQELVKGKKVKVSIPVRLYGDADGIKEGGSLVTVMRKIEVKGSVEHLVPELLGDITELKLSHSIFVRDMEIPKELEILQDLGAPVGYIEVPRSLKSAESAVEEGEEGVEGEEGEATTEEEATATEE